MKNEKIDAALLVANQEIENSIENLFALMRIPSISSMPEHNEDCRKCAQKISDSLKELGFDSSVREGLGLPLVVAHGGEGEKHILFYGHYDVQPVDPLELWSSPPFEPCIKNINGKDVIFGRGSSDDKGQTLTFIEACRAWIKANGTLPCRVTILLEGEEESDSISLVPFMKENVEELKADAAFICDTERWNEETPAITIGLRGNITGDVKIIAAKRDLHSGLYGGPARNPIVVLCDALSKMRDETGHVTLEGFYDGVPVLSDKIKENWKNLGFDEVKFLKDVGLEIPAGEDGFSVVEKLWARPTAEICGINGGYIGEGFKTVIPSMAYAKVSFRLVGNQDPDKIWAAFEKHIKANVPEDCEIIFKKNIGGRGIALDEENPFIKSTMSALEAEWNKPAALIGCGASIPVVNEIRDILGVDALLVGFALPDDNIHSPNEKYDVNSYKKAISSWVRIIGEMGNF